jgi:hypothetical protein
MAESTGRTGKSSRRTLPRIRIGHQQSGAECGVEVAGFVSMIYDLLPQKKSRSRVTGIFVLTFIQ